MNWKLRLKNKTTLAALIAAVVTLGVPGGANGNTIRLNYLVVLGD